MKYFINYRKKEVLVLNNFLALAQGNLSKEVKFETFELKLENHDFNLVEVIDNRLRPFEYGNEENISKNTHLINYMDFFNEVKNWFNSTYRFDPNLPNIVLIINNIDIVTGFNIESECYGNVDVYVIKNDYYFKIAEYNSKIFGKIKYFPFSLINDVLSTITKELIVNRLNEKRLGIRNLNEKLLDPYSGQFQPQAGVYQLFEDFLRNSPSTFYTDKIKTLHFLKHEDNHFVGNWKKNKIIYENMKIEPNFWGYSDGVNVFYRFTDNYFVKVFKHKDNFYFKIEDIKNSGISPKKFSLIILAINIFTRNWMNPSPEIFLEDDVIFIDILNKKYTDTSNNKYFVFEKKTGRFREVKSKI
jgi:hypothetical protein